MIMGNKIYYIYALMSNNTGISINCHGFKEDGSFLCFYESDKLIRILPVANLICIYIAESEEELYSIIPA
jgi:hypothetical protein